MNFVFELKQHRTSLISTRFSLAIKAIFKTKIDLLLQHGKNVTFVPSDTDYDIPMDHWNMTSRDDRKSHLLQGIRLSTEFINSLMWFATIRKLTEYRGSAAVLDTTINGKKIVKKPRFHGKNVVNFFFGQRNRIKFVKTFSHFF